MRDKYCLPAIQKMLLHTMKYGDNIVVFNKVRTRQANAFVQ
jgi:hypothetical protein